MFVVRSFIKTPSMNTLSLCGDLDALSNKRTLPGELRHAEDNVECQAFLAHQAATESNARSYPRKLPFALAQAKGVYVKDVDGNVYFDCLGGAGSLALGHNHDAVKDAIRTQLDADLPMLTLDITTPVKQAFVDAVLSLFPPEFARRARIQFCGPSGADAVEAAIKLVKHATGRRGVMSFQGGYHGMTHGALSLTGNLGAKKIAGLMADVHFLPYPYQYRPPFGKAETFDTDCSAYIENLLTDDESGVLKPAAIILEAMQGEGGKIPASARFMRELRRITQEQDVPLIVDEVQTGLGRTGRMFAFEHAGIVPDVVVLSKAIGGGQPMAMVVYHEKLDVWGPGTHAGTFRGNQLGMAAGLATIRTIRELDLVGQAARMGELFLQELRSMAQDHACMGDVRGLGLMLGVEIINPWCAERHHGQPVRHGVLARRIQIESFARGLVLELGGRQGSVVRLLPPLIVTEAQVRHICAILREAIAAAELALRPQTAALIEA